MRVDLTQSVKDLKKRMISCEIRLLWSLYNYRWDKFIWVIKKWKTKKKNDLPHRRNTSVSSLPSDSNWVSSLSTYTSDFTIASLQNYISHFYEIHLSLIFFFFFGYPMAYGDSKARDQIWADVAAYATAVATVFFNPLQREATNPCATARTP